jgi:hypothetical protein
VVKKSTNRRKAVQKQRKAVQKQKRKKGDWTNCGRGEFRKQGGTVVAAAVGQEYKTCVPDATYVCVKMQGGDAATVQQARGCMPKNDSTSLADMRSFLATYDCEAVSAGDYGCKPMKTLSLTSGHHIIFMKLWDSDGDAHRHACALCELDGEMYILDNMARRPAMKIGPEDRVSQKAALKVFAGTDYSLFPGAEKLVICSVSTVRRVVPVDHHAKRERNLDADDRVAKRTKSPPMSGHDPMSSNVT